MNKMHSIEVDDGDNRKWVIRYQRSWIRVWWTLSPGHADDKCPAVATGRTYTSVGAFLDACGTIGLIEKLERQLARI